MSTADPPEDAAPLRKQARHVKVHAREVEYVVRGQGMPVILLESGLGDDLTSWIGVFEALSERTRTMAYSRAGLGASTPGSNPRDLPTVSGELWQLLRALNEPSPFILVGHSWGGLIVQALAATRPEQIAGMLLVDSAHPELMEQLHRDTPEDAQAFDQLAREVYAATAREELKAFSAPGGGHFPGEDRPYSGPTLILAAWMFDFNHSKALRHCHRRRAEEVAHKYPQGEFRRIHCGHRIQEERPLAVIEAVDELLARARACRE